jgi:hypothetical protein
MSPRFLRLAAPFVATVTLAAAAPLAAGASTPAQSKAPMSDAGCEAFNDYFQVNLAIALIAGFAEAFEGIGDESDGVRATATTTTTTTTAPDDAQSPDIQLLQNILFLTLSPKMEQATTVLAKEAPRATRKLFAQQRDIYRDGVAALRELGLSKAQIEAIRDADFTEETPDSLAGDLDIDKADLEAAARQFGEQTDVLTAQEATESQSSAFEKVAIGCGAVPDSSLDCDEVVSADLQQQLLDGPAQVDSSGGTCTYTGDADSAGNEPQIGVDVYRSTDTFDRIVAENDSAEKVAGGAAVDGYSTFSNFKSCGRTLYAKAKGSTIVVAVCLPDDADVPDDMLNDVRDSVASVVT